MRRDRACLFLVHTPFQKYVAEAMLDTLSEFERAENYALLDGIGCDRSRPVHWDGTFTMPGGVGANFLLGAGRRAHRLCAKAMSALSDYRHIDILVANVDYPIGNAAYRAYKMADDSRVQLMSYPEGVANIVPTRPRIRKTIKNVVKTVGGFLTGTPFTWYGEDVAALDEAVRIYTLLPEALPQYADKTVQIALPKTKRKIARGLVLLGFPNDYNLPSREYRSLKNRLLECGRDMGIEPVLYKPHPREDPLEVRRWLKEQETSSLPARASIEELFMNRPYSHVMGARSSALLHLKILFGSQVNCYMLDLKPAIYRRSNDREERRRELKKLMMAYGIQEV